MPKYSINRYQHVAKKKTDVMDGNNVKKIGEIKTSRDFNQYANIDLYMKQRSVKRRLENYGYLSYQELIRLSYDLNTLFSPSTLRNDQYLTNKKKELEKQIYTLNKRMYSSNKGREEFMQFMNHNM